jgi:hypothetical protein
MAVCDHLLHKGQRRRLRIIHGADHRATIEDQLLLKFSGELLHAVVIHEAANLSFNVVAKPPDLLSPRDHAPHLPSAGLYRI